MGEEVSLSTRRKVLTTPPLLCSFREVNVFLSFSLLRSLSPREMVVPSSLGSRWAVTSPLLLPGLQSGEEGDEELFRENNKTFDVTTGRIEMEVNKVNVDEQEIGGVFVSTQLGDTDMGSKVPKKILSKGIFYARVE